MSKIWVILLMEADFNAANKIVYGNRMLANASKYKLMPEDIFSEINRMADDGVVAKILFYDIVRQRRVSAGIASVDAANCYDRMSHSIASLVFQSIRVAEKYVTAMLEAIEETKSFLQKSYGDSKEFSGSTIRVKTQGLCQVNGATSSGWCVISITIIPCHKRKGYGAKFLAPISLRKK